MNGSDWYFFNKVCDFFLILLKDRRFQEDRGKLELYINESNNKYVC